MLLGAAVIASASLDAHIAQLDAGKSTCSACNLVSKHLDAESLSSKLVKGWKDWTAVKRGEEKGYRSPGFAAAAAAAAGLGV